MLWDKYMIKDKNVVLELLTSLILILLGVIIYIMANRLPEWMVGIMTVGAIITYECFKIIGVQYGSNK